MALSAERKNGIIQMEYGAFIQSTSKAPKGYSLERYTYKGQTCSIFRDKGDPEGKEKSVAIKLAVRTIRDKNFDLPADLKIYCVADVFAQNRAFNKDPAWNDMAIITLGITALKNGRPDALSGMINPGFTKGAVTCIHEIGHLLHAHARGDGFHDDASNLTGGAPTHAGQVSGYAAQNKKEFVAEVFAGLMVGRTYSNAVMTEYLGYGGPH